MSTGLVEATCPVAAAARAWPDAPAVIWNEGGWNYREFHRRIAGCASRLAAAGIRPGDRVALDLPPSAECLALLVALWRRGAAACLLNRRWPDSSRAEAAERIGANAIITPDSLAEWIGDGEDEPTPIDLSLPATILFTSGSSGAPKPAVHSFGNHHASAHASNRNIPLAPGDRWLLSLPLYHVGGIGVIFRCWLGGAAVALPTPGEDMTDTLRRHTVTHVSLVGTQLHRMLREDRAAKTLIGMRAILLGGGAIGEGLVREAEANNLRIHTSYGMTETSSQIVCTRPGDTSAHLKTSGRPLTEGTVAISSEGEILVRGQTLFLGYLDGESVIRQSNPEGWFATGDLGAMDDDGYLRVTGRRDNLIVSGGENIQPEEVEAALANIEGVAEAMVVPVAEEEFGQRPVAFVRMDEDAPSIPDERLRAELARTLPRFKIPVTFHPWPEDSAQPGFKPSRAEFAKRAGDIGCASAD